MVKINRELKKSNYEKQESKTEVEWNCYEPGLVVAWHHSKEGTKDTYVPGLSNAPLISSYFQQNHNQTKPVNETS